LYGPFVLILALVAAACARFGVPPYLLTREPQNLGGVAWYAGSLSMLTGWLWCSTSAVCLLSWSVLRRRPREDRLPSFLLYFGLLTLALMLDDAFQLHEQADGFGVPEKAFYGAYLGALLAGLFTYRFEVRRSELLLFASGGFFLGLSIFVDVLQARYGERLGPWRIYFEDGFKLLGTVGWLGFFWAAATRALGAPPAARSWRSHHESLGHALRL